MKRSNKKGFTTVELVIVIAVIAILAAVLIPTFSNLIKKANESADTQTAKSMNTALAAQEAEGGAAANFAEAQAAIRGAGYILGNLNPTAAGNYFVWESKTNQVLLVDEDMKVLFKAEDLDESCDSIEDGTWYIALNDTSALEGIEGVQIIPSMTNKDIDSKGDNVKNLLKDGGTVTLSENVAVTTAPTHSDGVKKDGIRVNAAEETTLDLNGQTLNASFSTADYRVFQVATDFNLSNGTITASGEAKEGGLWGVVRGYNGAKINVKNMQISYTNTLANSTKPGGVFSIVDDSELLLEDSTLVIGNSTGMEIANSVATLKNVTLKSAGDRGWCTAGITVSYGGTINIESGYYEAQGDVLCVLSTGGTINVKGGTFEGILELTTASNAVADSKIVISGGTFNGKPYSSYSVAQWEEMVKGEQSVTIENGVVTILLPKA